eukprot:15310468-Alexandrium_andersonii.AAC.1
MSASLVGSEMCIRDRPMPAKCAIMLWQSPAMMADRPATGAASKSSTARPTAVSSACGASTQFSTHRLA